MDITLKIKKEYSFDLVVVGGGVSGFSCALSAARQGMKVAIIEKLGLLGGTATACGVLQMLGGRKLNSNTKLHDRVIGGIFDEITDELIKNKEAVEPNDVDLSFNPYGWYPRMASGIVFNEESLKRKLENKLINENVRIFYNTNVISTNIYEKKISSIIATTINGIIKIDSKLFADCSGNGDVAYLSNCETTKGQEDGLMTPVSLEMHLENINIDELVTYQNKNNSPKLVEIIDKLKTNGLWKFNYDIFIAIKLISDNSMMINTIRQILVDGTKEEDITKALIEGRKENYELFKIIKQFFPGFKNARIKRIYDNVGIRETRRIIGLTMITTTNALNGKRYNDSVASTTYNFDLPSPTKPSFDSMMKNRNNPNAKRKYTVIEIPFRALINNTIDNLIVAGRCISAEREVLGALRVMGPCMGMGEIAGIASSLAINTDCNYKNISISTLKTKAKNLKLIIPDELYYLNN